MKTDDAEIRNNTIVRASIVGIAVNLILVLMKVLMGLLVNSMAMMLDAANNLSDVLSSVITLIGTKLASKKPDKKHPFGFGRVEHLASMLIAGLVFYAGISVLVAAVKELIHPGGLPQYSVDSLVVMVIAIVFKLVLGLYFRRTAKQTDSASLHDTGTDAMFDAILTASVLASAVVFMFTGIVLETWVSIAISLFIIHTGTVMLRESVDEVLGKRFDPELTHSIRKMICEDEDVLGAYNLTLHSYGPERLFGSVHVKVHSTMTAEQIDVMERRITRHVLKQYGVMLEGIGIYSEYQGSDDMYDRIIELARAHDGVLQVNGFFVDNEEKRAGFDLVLDYDIKNRHEIYQEVCDEVRAEFPDYKIYVTMDIDF